MAATAAKFGSTERQGSRTTTRQSRVARIASKTPRSTAGPGVVADRRRQSLGGTQKSRSKEASSKVRADGGTYLSMYFRDMATLEVQPAEQEFVTAKQLEQLEIQLWEEVLRFRPTVGQVLACVQGVISALPAEGRALVAAATPRTSQDAWRKLVTRCARKLRQADVDHLLIEAALVGIDKISRGIGSRGGALETSGTQHARADWLHRVHVASRAVAAARNDFVKANLRLVVSIARRFNYGRMALSDLIQEGNLGLMKAIERYDYRRGFRFSTYASWWIRHAISRALADKGREVRLPVHMIDAQNRIAKARRNLTTELGRQPNSEELAAATQMPVEKVERMRTWLLDQSISIDKPLGDEEGRLLGEVLEDPERDYTPPTQELEWEALSKEVQELLHQLRPIEADILRQRFGLGAAQEMTLKEIGEKYSLSRERIRQLQEQALDKMRRALGRRDLL